MEEFKNNYYSDELKDGFNRSLGKNTTLVDIENFLGLLFNESNQRMKNISPKYKNFFPTTKYNKGWRYGSIVGLIHILSGGLSIKRAIEWESSFIKTNDNKDVINDISSAFIVDLNGDIYNMIDLRKVIEDRNGYDGVLSIKIINAGLLKISGSDFVWHGSKKNRWMMKYPYENLKPVYISGENYYQPFSREQINSIIIIHKILRKIFPLINPIIGNTFFNKMLDSTLFIESLTRDDNSDYLSIFPSFL